MYKRQEFLKKKINSSTFLVRFWIEIRYGFCPDVPGKNKILSKVLNVKKFVFFLKNLTMDHWYQEEGMHVVETETDESLDLDLDLRPIDPDLVPVVDPDDPPVTEQDPVMQSGEPIDRDRTSDGPAERKRASEEAGDSVCSTEAESETAEVGPRHPLSIRQKPEVENEEVGPDERRAEDARTADDTDDRTTDPSARRESKTNSVHQDRDPVHVSGKKQGAAESGGWPWSVKLKKSGRSGSPTGADLIHRATSTSNLVEQDDQAPDRGTNQSLALGVRAGLGEKEKRSDSSQLYGPEPHQDPRSPRDRTIQFENRGEKEKEKKKERSGTSQLYGPTH